MWFAFVAAAIGRFHDHDFVQNMEEEEGVTVVQTRQVVKGKSQRHHGQILRILPGEGHHLGSKVMAGLILSYVYAPEEDGRCSSEPNRVPLDLKSERFRLRRYTIAPIKAAKKMTIEMTVFVVVSLRQ